MYSKLVHYSITAQQLHSLHEEKLEIAVCKNIYNPPRLYHYILMLRRKSIICELALQDMRNTFALFKERNVMLFQSASCITKSDALHMPYTLHRSIHKNTLLLNGKTFGSIKTTHWPQTCLHRGDALLTRIYFDSQEWISNPTLR